MSETLRKLQSNLKEAMKAREGERAGFLRFLLSYIHNQEIENRGKGNAGELSETEVLTVLQREMKRKKEAIRLFEEGGRNDLVEKENQELAWLLPYLPVAPTREEIERVVRGLKEKGVNDFPSIMKEAMPLLSGADGKEVAEVVKTVLAE